MTTDFMRLQRQPFCVPGQPCRATSTGRDSLQTCPCVTIDQILSGPCSTVPHRVIPLSDRAGGPRIVSSPVSGLVVGIAPLDETSVLTAHPCFSADAAYACLSAGDLGVPQIVVRPGETLDLPRRIAEHLANAPCRIEHLVMVGAADPTFAPLGKDGVMAIQWLLYRLAQQAGRAVVHGGAPARPWLLDREPQRLMRWSADLQPLLRATGTPAFTPTGCVVAPRPVASDPIEQLRAILRGYHTDIPAGATEQDGADLYTVAWRRVQARATVVDGCTVVHAGATVDPVDHSGVQPGIVAKRRHMVSAGVLQKTAAGLLRLTCDAVFPTPTNALRVLTGTNLRGDLWQRAL